MKRRWARKFIQEIAFIVAVSLGLHYGAHLTIFQSVTIAFIVSIHSMVLDVWLKVMSNDSDDSARS